MHSVQKWWLPANSITTHCDHSRFGVLVSTNIFEHHDASETLNMPQEDIHRYRYWSVCRFGRRRWPDGFSSHWVVRAQLWTCSFYYLSTKRANNSIFP